VPIEIPSIDNRRYQQLLDEALARIPVHTPEWTNFNDSDPGVTLIQVFAFITESMLYRANRIPDRNRRKFLQLLGLPLQPASPAQGVVTLINARGPQTTITLDRDLELRAGQIPFRTSQGLDVLPIEAEVCFKSRLSAEPEEMKTYYRELYASFLEPGAESQTEVQLYERTPLLARGPEGVEITKDAVDSALWIALLARPKESVAAARDAIAGKTISLGLVPILEAEDAKRRLAPSGTEAATSRPIRVELPSIPASGKLAAGLEPAYRTLTTFAMPAEPAVFEVTLPVAAQLMMWENIDPLELGAGNFPPTLEDTAMADRVITWLRIVWPDGVASKISWAGINAVRISQRTHVANEVLPEGTGEPDQAVVVANPPVIAPSLHLFVTPPEGETKEWIRVEDLLSAGPEVPGPDWRLPPGVTVKDPPHATVFVLDAEAGRIRFGDGARGARPPAGAMIRVDYDFAAGRAGNVAENAINQAPALPAGLQVTNPVRTWGGADSESIAEGEKQISRYLQHRDRLVTMADFETIARRTPGVDVGRVDVLPAFNPALTSQEAGNAPGAVTLMLIPKYSAIRPDAPSPDSAFLSAVCAWLDPRRLVTTELFLEGPKYVPIWISIAVEIVAAQSEADAPNSTALIREAVKQRLKAFLSPVRPDGTGWPLRRTVLRLELVAEASRVPGVALVNELFLAARDGASAEMIPMTGLELPRLDGLEVTIGPDPLGLDQLRGVPDAGATPPNRKRFVPVPTIPAEC
jgi:hypothetical protein